MQKAKEHQAAQAITRAGAVSLFVLLEFGDQERRTHRPGIAQRGEPMQLVETLCVFL